MSGFSVESLARKLQKVNESQESVESLSLWLIHHIKHAEKIAEAWIHVYRDAKPDRYQALFYVVNDVLQNGRRRGNDFTAVFRPLLPNAMALSHGRKCQSAFERILIIWEERRLFNTQYVAYLRQILAHGSGYLAVVPSPVHPTEEAEERCSINEAVEGFQQVEATVASKLARLNATRINAWDADILSAIKDKGEGYQFREELDEAIGCLKDCCEYTANELDAHQHLLTALQNCLLDQREDAVIAKKLVKQMTLSQSHVHKVFEAVRVEKRRSFKSHSSRSHKKEKDHIMPMPMKKEEDDRQTDDLLADPAAASPPGLVVSIPPLETGASFLPPPKSILPSERDVIESTDMDIDSSESDTETTKPKTDERMFAASSVIGSSVGSRLPVQPAFPVVPSQVSNMVTSPLGAAIPPLIPTQGGGHSMVAKSDQWENYFQNGRQNVYGRGRGRGLHHLPHPYSRVDEWGDDTDDYHHQDSKECRAEQQPPYMERYNRRYDDYRDPHYSYGDQFHPHAYY